ncbi:hypothetical protein JX265_001806 [Neoarthrinium moseri]|uniref:Uncharacterized protein n=1 Tax=Neoarthrinium moseri TaxID=1658444 RepID=A0A9P9WW47_9PEZI|nr:uncharacterized protein JN550_005385 [Neoarthrinium moseri]KAI1843458.1 hypothetical protein JX266_010284 [Neoarthrinium moseri]KAI1870457.1 hypothetical protein JN550_005385 [Neoarthrinium moseri]KAI1880185.1 hypothetical protein JX265_001806 [Neoarthrinium moseri]
MRQSSFIALPLLSAFAGAASIRPDMRVRNASQVLQPGEFIYANKGKMEIVNETRLRELMLADGISLEKPALDEEWLNFTPPNNTNSSSSAALSRRDGCDSSFITDKTETFADWDIQMSPVVLGASTGIDVTISNGWTVSNSVSVSAGVEYTVIKDVLGLSFGIDYTRTWTSSASQLYKVSVPDGSAGTWVTRPWTTRRYGRTFSGCPGSLVQTGTWTADSREEGSYDSTSWVSGVITACVKEVPNNEQLTRCVGEGTFA